MYEQQVVDFLAQIEQADAEASEAQLAFAVGKFDEYWRRKAAETLARLEAQYDAIASGGNSGTGSGDDTGTAGSSGSGGTSESSEDAA